MTGFSARRLTQIPDLLAVHQSRPEFWPFLLASEVHCAQLGRWSLLLHQRGETIQAERSQADAVSFIASLQQRLGPLRSACPVRSDLPSLPDLPFMGGWFVYLGYELAAGIEQRLSLPPAQDRLPVALAARCPGAIIIDHAANQAWACGESQALVDDLISALQTVAADEPAQPSQSALPALHIQADPGESFKLGVERVKQLILAGDVFQVNLSRGWRAESAEALCPVNLYRALARANPAPFAALARLPSGTIVSSSPERLVGVRGRKVHTRPIAGTRPRGINLAADHGLKGELIANAKERAEHIMLIDLERNDLGRVCVPGSVEVDELMVVESYAHVHHIVSNVCGQLRDGVTPMDVMSAVFPGGTITGCPKVRCMEIIADLEGQGRGFYTGSMGYVGLNGVMDLNILIRTMVVEDKRLSFRTGAGIVADSDPAAELAETEAKARGLLKALGAR